MLDIKIFRNDIVLIFILYTLSHGLILLSNGIYWDDWVLYNVDKDLIINHFSQTGLPWVGYIHSFLLSFKNSLFLYRSIVFLLYLLSALFLNSILKNIREIDDISRLLLVFFFAIFPVNSARISLITIPYTLCYFLGFLGAWMTSLYMKNKNIILRFSILPVFFFSFTTSSILVFYLIILPYIFYIEKVDIISYRLFKKVFTYMDLFILPIVFFIIKSIFLNSHGLYKGYNQITFEGVLIAPIKSVVAFYTSFIQVIYQSLQTRMIILALILTCIIYLIRKRSISNTQENNNPLWISLGFLMFFMAVFPYAVVGKIPFLEDWESRHQLLIPLGASFILVYGVRLVIKNVTVRDFLYTFFILIFLFSNISNYIAFQKDWYKQLSLMENFRNSKEMINNNTFLFDDKTLELNANDRSYRFYEYAGLMKEAFEEETRFGDNLNHQSIALTYNELKPFLSEPYNIANYVPGNAEYIVVIEHGNNLLGINNLIKLGYQEIFNQNEFKKNIKNIINLRFVKI